LEHLLALVASWIKSIIGSGGYVGIAFLMALESACIPIPSEVTMPVGGALTTAAVASSIGHVPFSFHMVAIAGAIGEALGASLAYFVGATGGRDFIFKYGRYILLRRKDVLRSEKWFQRYGAGAIFGARLLPVVRTFISLPAGIARMAFAPFLLLSFLGSLCWCYLLTYLGVQFANHLDDLKRYFHGADAIIVVLVVAAAGFWIAHHLKPEPAESASE
jgi:membrane protein DedA with SNARE-associated domain